MKWNLWSSFTFPKEARAFSSGLIWRVNIQYNWLWWSESVYHAWTSIFLTICRPTLNTHCREKPLNSVLLLLKYNSDKTPLPRPHLQEARTLWWTNRIIGKTPKFDWGKRLPYWCQIFVARWQNSSCVLDQAVITPWLDKDECVWLTKQASQFFLSCCSAALIKGLHSFPFFCMLSYTDSYCLGLSGCFLELFPRWPMIDKIKSNITWV